MASIRPLLDETGYLLDFRHGGRRYRVKYPGNSFKEATEYKEAVNHKISLHRIGVAKWTPNIHDLFGDENLPTRSREVAADIKGYLAEISRRNGQPVQTDRLLPVPIW